MVKTLPVKEIGGDNYLVFATKKGVIKKTLLEAYVNVRSSGIIAVGLEEGDELVDTKLTDGTKEIMIATANGRAIRFSERDVRPMGRPATVRGIRLGEGDKVVSMAIVTQDAKLLTITENGFGKISIVGKRGETQEAGTEGPGTGAPEEEAEEMAEEEIEEPEEAEEVCEEGSPAPSSATCTARPAAAVRVSRPSRYANGTGRCSRCSRCPRRTRSSWPATKGTSSASRLRDFRVLGRVTMGVRVKRLEEGEKVIAVARLIGQGEERMVEETEAKGDSLQVEGGQEGESDSFPQWPGYFPAPSFICRRSRTPSIGTIIETEAQLEKVYYLTADKIPESGGCNKVFRNSIQGLDKVFRTDIEVPKVVLITGPPGSDEDLLLLFDDVVLSGQDQRVWSLCHIGGDSGQPHQEHEVLEPEAYIEPGDLRFHRPARARQDRGGRFPTDYLQFIIQTIGYYKKKHGDRFTVFSLDSLGALYSLMDDVKGMRKKMFYFFKTLRDYNLMSFIVMERNSGTPSDLLGNEGFLVDGIIELGLDRTRGKLVRYMRVEKMRATEHSMERHTMEVGDNRLTL